MLPDDVGKLSVSKNMIPVFSFHLSISNTKALLVIICIIDSQPLNKNKFCIPKSRYAPISYYLSPCSQDYNDLDAPYDPHIYQQLIDNGHLLKIILFIIH